MINITYCHLYHLSTKPSSCFMLLFLWLYCHNDDSSTEIYENTVHEIDEMPTQRTLCPLYVQA